MSDPFAKLHAHLAATKGASANVPQYTPDGPPPPTAPVAPQQVRNPNPTGYDPNKLRNPGEGFGGYLGEAFDAANRAVNYGMVNAITFNNADEIAGSLGELRGKGYAESRDEYRDARAAADAASPYSMEMAQASTNIGMGALSKAGLALQAGAGALEGLGRSDAMDAQAFLNTVTGAALPLALPAAGAVKDGVVAGARGLGNIARKVVHNPAAEQVLSAGIAKGVGGTVGSAAGPLGTLIGVGTKPNMASDAMARKVMEGVRARVKPPTAAIPEAPPPASLSIPPLSSALDTPVSPNLSLPPKPGIQSMDDFLGPESIGPVTGRPAALGAVPKGAIGAPEIGINPMRMGPEDYRGSVGPDYADVQFPKPAPVPSQSAFPTNAYVAPTPAPWGADPHAYPSRIPTAPQVEGPNYFDFQIPKPAPAPAPPIETVNTLRPPALPSLPPGTQATNPYVPGTRPIPPSIQEPPSFAAINAPTTPYNPPAPAGAANRMTLRHGEAPPSFVPQPTPAQPSRQTVPFVERLAKAAEVTDNPEVQTTLEKIATMHAEDPIKASAYHKVQLSKNPAYRETLRIIEGK